MASYEVTTKDGQTYEVVLPETAPSSKSSKEFLPFAGTSVGAIGSSSAEYAKSMGQAIRHPIQIAQGLGNIGLGAAQKLIPGTQSQEPYADAVGDFYQRRYGNFDAFRETWKRDPVGVVADAASILTGVGGGVTAAGKAATLSKISSVAGLPKAIRVGQVLSATGQAIDPLMVTARAARFAGRLPGSGSIQQSTAGHMVNALIKPSNRQFSYGKNPGLAIAQEGIVASNLEDLAMKAAQRRDVVGQQIGQALSIPLVSQKRLNLISALDPIHEALRKARQNPRVNGAVIQRLENLRDDLLGVPMTPTGTTTVTRNWTSMSPMEAFEIKKMIGDLTKWTESHSDDSIVNAALKKTYAKVRAGIESVAPGIRPLNERWANLMEAASAAQNRARAMQRIGGVGLLEGGMLAGGVAFGKPLETITAVLLARGARAALQSPRIRTEMARWIGHATPTEVEAFFNRIPGLKSEVVRIGLLAGTGQQRLQDATSPTQ